MVDDVVGRNDIVAWRGPDTDPVRSLLHDLREPLAAILLLSETSQGDVRERLVSIQEQASWLAEVVAASLEGAAGDHVADIDARALANEVAGRARMSTTTTIDVEVVGECRVLARPVALARALGCLVDNAVRAAGPAGHVLIWVGSCDDAFHIRVLDDGPGLGRLAPRTSIGLATTRAMVAACRGRFRLAARPDGGAAADIVLQSRSEPDAVAL
ncbi:sensor histidine kinase [Terrabacter sp. 2RAF25]|uniref:sensor histidine kinase n=1 Tax=Terrabacter sp. 2RAF25 TaxID=3232998 RepID=UPI003F95D9C1